MDWIQGDKFIGLAKFIFAFKMFPDNDYRSLVNTFEVSKLKDYDIVYTHTMYVKELFGIIKNTDKEIFLITHNCDTNIDSSFHLPDNVI
jgi:hypothetical protein